LYITLKNADRISIRSLDDLAAMVPDGMTGDALNYGQGEGQLRIGESVWGFYVVDSGVYSCVLEEGVLSFEEASEVALGIIGRMRSLWGTQIESEVRGCHHDDPEMRLT
jgi:hypothetical protein